MARATLTLLSRAALALALVLLMAWVVQPVPWVLRVVPAALTALSLARPAVGLMTLAALGAMAGPVTTYAGAPGSSPAFLEQLILAAIAGVSLRLWRDREPARLAAVAILLAAIAAASAVAAQPELWIRASPGTPAIQHAGALLAGAYFVREPMWQPLHAGALLIEGLALAVTVERALRREPAAIAPVLWMLLAGVTAIALLNVSRLAEVAARTGDLAAALPGLLLQLRVSRYYDVNAGGTVFLMTVLTAFGLIGHRWRWGLAVVVPVLFAGLWLTGSRTALAIFVMAVALSLLHAVVTLRGGRRWAAASLLIILTGATATASLLYPAGRNMGASPALATRRILAETSVAMWRSAPILGIGVGRFYAESSRFGATALQEELNFQTANENAHNNFLQVLAELGLAGLLALLVVLGGTLAAAVRAQRYAPSLARQWLLVGLGAGLLTWLTGHPQLVPDAAFVFWLLFGALAATTAVPSPGRAAPAVAAILTIVVIASVPFRVRAARAAADLEHIGIGVSLWHPDQTVDRYRDAGAEFALYLPGDGSTVTLPVRRAADAPSPLRLSFHAGGQLLNEVAISGDGWHRIPISFTSRGWDFELVHFTVTADRPVPADRPVIHVGIAR